MANGDYDRRGDSDEEEPPIQDLDEYGQLINGNKADCTYM